jgi:hypothetical protein
MEGVARKHTVCGRGMGSMTLWEWFGLFALGLVTAGLFVWHQERKKRSHWQETSDASRGRSRSKPMQTFLPIERVEPDGTIALRDGGLRRILRVGNVNPYALSGHEAESIRANFQTMLSTLREPFQFVVRGRRMDLTDYFATLDATVEETARKWEDDRLLEYGRQLHRHLESRGEKQRTLRENLWVTTAHRSFFPGHGGEEEARHTVQQETETVFAGLLRCRVHPVVLGAEEAIEAQQQFLDRDKVHARARDAVRLDSLRGYFFGKEEMTIGKTEGSSGR